MSVAALVWERLSRWPYRLANRVLWCSTVHLSGKIKDLYDRRQTLRRARRSRVRYADAEDAAGNAMVKRPIAACVAKVHEQSDLSQPGLGTWLLP